MELNYLKTYESHKDAARKAAAIMLGSLEGIRNMAWIDNDFILCQRMNNVILKALESAGTDWQLYELAINSCNDYQHKLNAIKTINGN